MPNIKLMIEIPEEDFKSIEYSTLLYFLNATPITESDDAVSRQAVLDHIYGINGLEGLELSNVFEKHYADFIKSLPPVTPKREENTVSEEVYTKEYIVRKELEYENYVLKQNMQALKCGNEATVEERTMDIFNNKERKVKCVRKYDTSPYGCDYEDLEIGKEYTVTNVDVYNWYTMITLAEFPNKRFNSVLFDEVE